MDHPLCIARTVQTRSVAKCSRQTRAEACAGRKLTITHVKFTLQLSPIRGFAGIMKGKHCNVYRLRLSVTFTRLALLAVLASVEAGCTHVRQDVANWLAGPPPAGEIRFAADKGLAVHEEASGSSPTVGRLTLNEKVIRSRVNRGFAYVTAPASGLAGWADDSRLVRTLPNTAKSLSSAGTSPKPRKKQAPAARTRTNAPTVATPAPKPATVKEVQPTDSPPPLSTPVPEAAALPLAAASQPPSPPPASTPSATPASAIEAAPAKAEPKMFDPF